MLLISGLCCSSVLRQDRNYRRITIVWCIFTIIYAQGDCRLLLIYSKNHILEQYLAECVANITTNYFDKDFPIVISTPKPIQSNPIYEYGNLLIQKLQSLNQFCLIILGNKNNETLKNVEKFTTESYVFVLPPNYRKKKVILFFDNVKSVLDEAFQSRGKVLIVSFIGNFLEVNGKPLSHHLLNLSFKFCFIQTLVLVPRTEISDGIIVNIRIFSWTINEQNNICSGKLDKIDQLDTWMSKKRTFLLNSNLFPLQKTLNLKGCALKYHTTRFLPFSTKICLDNYCGPIEHILPAVSKAIHTTFKFTKRVKEGYVVFPAYYKPNSTRKKNWRTYPHFRQDVIWFVPSSSEVPQWQSLVRTFNPLIWFLIAVACVFGSFTMWILGSHSKYSSETSARLCISSVLMCTLLSHLGVGVAERYKGVVAVLFFMLWLYYCLVINTAYQSALSGLLVNPGYLPAIETLEELEESGLIMERRLTENGGSFWTKFNRYQRCQGSEQACFKKVSIDRTHALIHGSWYGKLYSNLFRDIYGKPQFKTLNQVEGTIYLCVYFTRFSCVLYSVFESVMQRLVSAGLIEKWISWTLWVWNLKQGVVRGDTVFAFTLFHLQGSFYLLVFGLSLASLVFVIEILAYYIQNYCHLFIIIFYLYHKRSL
ncbi:Ionotropic receptor 299 [Blattella germanica]|nr:Ionotropic receptor 299 [Blattella germanica]